MVDSDKDMNEEELETEEDLDDLWDDDDDLAQEDLEPIEGHPASVMQEDDAGDAINIKPKKKGISKLFLFILIICFLPLMALPFLGNIFEAPQDNIPVIKIDEQASEIPAEEVSAPQETSPLAEILKQQDQDVAIPDEPMDQAPEMLMETEETVLTPLPENLEDMPMALPELSDATEAEDAQSMENALIDDSIMAETETLQAEDDSAEVFSLQEDELLSRTEELPGDTDVLPSVEENTALEDIMSQNQSAMVEEELPVVPETIIESLESLPEELVMAPTKVVETEQEQEDLQMLEQPEMAVEGEESIIEEAPEPESAVEPEIEEVIETTEPEQTIKEGIPAQQTEKVEFKQAVEAEMPPASAIMEENPPVVPQKTEMQENPTPKTEKIVKKEWVIRAAQAGKAVIYDKISTEMKSIEVGDTVTGLGLIKSIKMLDGQWVIQGTKNKLTQ